MKQKQKKQKKKLISWILLLAWMAFIFYMSQQIGQVSSGQSGKIVLLLSKIGIDIKETSDGFIVVGKNTLAHKPVKSELECYHDHRLAMSFFVAGLLCENEIAINGFEWTKISFPEFENLINLLL